MTAFSFGARLHLGANSKLALSLPQSRLCILWARQLCPLAVLRSCFGYSLSHLRTAAACLSRCIRHRRRSKAKPLRGSRGGYRRKGTELAQCMPQQLRPPEAGGPHPSRCSAKAQHRATFPKGKAKRCGGAPKAPSTNKHKKSLSQSRQALYFAASQPYSLFSF